MGELQIHLNVGLALAMSRRWDEAAQELEAAIAAGPQDAEAHFQLGKVYQSMGRASKAEIALKRSCELDGHRPEAKARLGAVLAQLGRPDAAKVLGEALQQDKGSTIALNALGDVALAGGLSEEAVHSWERSLEIEPAQAETAFKLAFALESLQRPREALTRYRMVKKLSPGRLPVLLAMAKLLESLDGLGADAEELAQILGELAARPEADASIFLRWSQALNAAGHDEAALDALRLALKADPSASEAALPLAWSLVDHGQTHKAESVFKDLLPALNGGPAKDLVEGWLSQMAGRMEDAIKAYQVVTAVEAEDLRAWGLLAALLYRRGELPAAEEAYKRLTELNPAHAEAYARLGSLSLKLGRREQAKTAWERALELEPDNTIVRKNLSVLKG